MFPNGYIMVDMKGFDLTGNGATITGIYEKFKGAVSSAKPTILYNSYQGNDMLSPINGVINDGETIQIFAYPYLITVASNDSVTSVNIGSGGGPKITTQPVDYTGAADSSASFTVEAVGSGLKYQWYTKDVGATSWTKPSTGTGSTYSFNLTSARDGRQVYCEITDIYGNIVNSNIVTATIST